MVIDLGPRLERLAVDATRGIALVPPDLAAAALRRRSARRRTAAVLAAVFVMAAAIAATGRASSRLRVRITPADSAPPDQVSLRPLALGVRAVWPSDDDRTFIASAQEAAEEFVVAATGGSVATSRLDPPIFPNSTTCWVHVTLSDGAIVSVLTGQWGYGWMVSRSSYRVVWLDNRPDRRLMIGRPPKVAAVLDLTWRDTAGKHAVRLTRQQFQTGDIVLPRASEDAPGQPTHWVGVFRDARSRPLEVFAG